MRHEIAAHERAAHEIAAHERAVHERAAHHRAGPLESPPQGAHQVCPLPPIERTMQFSPISGGELMADPLLKFPPRSLAGEHFNQPLNFGCLDISSRAAEKTKKTEGNPPLPRIPSVQNMLDESRILGRVASGDPKAPDFQIREVSEHEFKQSYVRELLRLKARTAPDLPDSELARFAKNVYKVEDPNGTFDTQAGTPEKYADSE